MYYPYTTTSHLPLQLTRLPQPPPPLMHTLYCTRAHGQIKALEAKSASGESLSDAETTKLASPSTHSLFLFGPHYLLSVHHHVRAFPNTIPGPTPQIEALESRAGSGECLSDIEMTKVGRKDGLLADLKRLEAE
jgi:hypothetical protein